MLANENKKCIIDVSVLPQSILLTLEVKEKLKNERISVKEACKSVGIPKATYYKFKDSVQIYKKSC